MNSKMVIDIQMVITLMQPFDLEVSSQLISRLSHLSPSHSFSLLPFVTCQCYLFLVYVRGLMQSVCDICVCVREGSLCPISFNEKIDNKLINYKRSHRQLVINNNSFICGVLGKNGYNEERMVKTRIDDQRKQLENALMTSERIIQLDE